MEETRTNGNEVNKRYLAVEDASTSAQEPHRGFRNHEGYPDPTPKLAMDRTAFTAARSNAKKVIMTLQNVAHIAGYDIKGRITLIDNFTGQEWR